MWEATKAGIQASGKWSEGMRLLNSGRRLWVVDQDEPFPLFQVVFTSKDTYNITVDVKNTTYYGLDTDTVTKVRLGGMPPQESA
jgi:hypothetical protein